MLPPRARIRLPLFSAPGVARMTIENGKVVTLQYSLFNADDGSEI